MFSSDGLVDDFAQAIFVAVEPIGAPADSPVNKVTGIPGGRAIGSSAGS